jgi:hypothetical protein
MVNRTYTHTWSLHQSFTLHVWVGIVVTLEFLPHPILPFTTKEEDEEHTNHSSKFPPNHIFIRIWRQSRSQRPSGLPHVIVKECGRLTRNNQGNLNIYLIYLRFWYAYAMYLGTWREHHSSIHIAKSFVCILCFMCLFFGFHCSFDAKY